MRVEMDINEEITVILGSMRYYLGRQSYAVSTFTDWLIKNWDKFTEYFQTVIKQELEEFIAKDDQYLLENEGKIKTTGPLGMRQDRASWDKVRAMYKK